jgi:predicted O-methyltransferase YrrM
MAAVLMTGWAKSGDRATLHAAAARTPPLWPDLGQLIWRCGRGWRSRLRAALKTAFPELYLWALVGRAAAIRSQTTMRERICLYEEACECVGSGALLEIGSYLGSTAVVLAEALRRRGGSPSVRVFCVDTWQNDAMGEGRWQTRAVFDANVKLWQHLIVPVVGYSRDVPVPAACDLIFIDGDHSYEGTRADVARFAPLVREGGRLVLHDHVYYHKTVAPVIGELLASGNWAIIRTVDNMIALRRNTTGPTPVAAVLEPHRD